jgi:hypothetical protein
VTRIVRDMSDILRERVARERKLRYKSDRAAADAGGISNTSWSRFMAGGELTDQIRHAVATAFDWPTDWPEHLPNDTPSNGVKRPNDVELRLGQILGAAEKAGEVLESMDERLRRIEEALEIRTRRQQPKATNGTAAPSTPSN